ncbi:MAG: hypothetical protein ACYC96_04035 [Fimbriimonadaceae bacterium]
MRFTKLFLATGLTALAVFGAAVDDGVLKVTGMVNDVRHYTITGNMSVGGNAATITGKVTQKVIKVDDNGNVTTQETESMTAEVNGQEFPVPDSVSVTVLKPDGTVVEIRGEHSTPEAYRIATVETVKYPDFPLATDKTWTYDFPADAKTGVVKAKGEYKVLGSETLHGIDSWKIQAKVTELEGDEPAGTESTTWINKKDGTLVKVDGKATNLPIPEAGGAVSGTEVLDLVPSADSGASK